MAVAVLFAAWPPRRRWLVRSSSLARCERSWSCHARNDTTNVIICGSDFCDLIFHKTTYRYWIPLSRQGRDNTTVFEASEASHDCAATKTARSGDHDEQVWGTSVCAHLSERLSVCVCAYVCWSGDHWFSYLCPVASCCLPIFSFPNFIRFHPFSPFNQSWPLEKSSWRCGVNLFYVIIPKTKLKH